MCVFSVCMYFCMYVCVYVFLYVCMCVCACMYEFLYVCMCVYVLYVQGGSNMTGTDFFVNKPHLTCASKCLVIMVF
jgi:hypothetical protein